MNILTTILNKAFLAKGKFLLIALIAISIFACKNDNSVTPDDEKPGAEAGVSTAVMYIDTFRIYSTDLAGANRKLLVDEDLKSENNYITSASVIPGYGKIVYGYTTGFRASQEIKIINADGSNKKTLKTLPSTAFVQFVKGVADGKVFYGYDEFTGNTNVRKVFMINEDGTGEKELTGLPGASSIRGGQISSGGGGLVTDQGYFAKLKDGVFIESESKNVLTTEDKTKITGSVILSADATKIAFISTTAAADKFEVRIKDITKNDIPAVVVYTYTVPANGVGAVPFPFFSLTWVDGSKRLLMSHGKFTMPKGAASDYVLAQIIDPATKSAVSWQFAGDGNGYFIAN